MIMTKMNFKNEREKVFSFCSNNFSPLLVSYSGLYDISILAMVWAFLLLSIQSDYDNNILSDVGCYIK